MLLAELVRQIGVVPPRGDLDVEISDLTHDSRLAGPHTAFACVRGARHDGHEFAPMAVAAGSPMLVVDHALDTKVPEIVVPDVRRALGPIAAVVHGDPSTKMAVVGVTGTNGKTTVTHLLGAILDAAGLSALVVGTLSGARTTPEGSDLQRMLAEAVSAGKQAVAMEVSSHALALHRVDGTKFAVGVFTNLGLDHLDFHDDMENYFDAKSRLFDSAMTSLGVVNRDDGWGRRLIEVADPNRCAIHTYGADDATDLTLSATGSSFRWRGHPMRVRLAGRFNVVNALAAATVADLLGVDASAIADGLESVETVRGRFESVGAISGDDDVHVVVDYSHKPDALTAVLHAAREISGGRVTVVIGAGGDRDRSKRPVMGRVASELADTAIITSDNPRSESPKLIVEEIIAGIDDMSNVTVELDRATAIREAIVTAEAGDLIVIAGKGHETTQTSGDLVTEFDDADHARRALELRRTRA